MNTMYDFAFSEQGYNHVKADKVCQDSSGCYSDENMVIAVVADGHGSDNYPRTDRGSDFAVESALKGIKEFVNTVKASMIDVSADSDYYLEQLSKNILSSWYDYVDNDLKKYPFSEEELSKVSEKYKKRYLNGERLEKAYGTTLIAACQTKEYWFGIQIGDGKCVCIMDDGSMYEPIPWDDDCQANITTSICDSEAIDEFRYFFMDRLPIATLMGTDGIDDSYSNSEEMYVLYRSILAIFAEHGREVGEEEIKTFLPGLSRKGSGDDVSIAGIISADVSMEFVEVLKAQCEYSNAKSLRAQAEREVKLAIEKHEYVADAMKKAKTNYELCVKKEEEAKEAIEIAQETQVAAIKRFATAEEILHNAIEEFQKNIASNEMIETNLETSLESTEESVESVEDENTITLENEVKETCIEDKDLTTIEVESLEK